MIRGDVEKLYERHLMGLTLPVSWECGKNIKVWWSCEGSNIGIPAQKSTCHNAEA